MIPKKELLSHLQKYSAEEIAEAVRIGTVTLYELSKDSCGAFTPLLKKQVQTILENSPKETLTTKAEQPNVSVEESVTVNESQNPTDKIPTSSVDTSEEEDIIDNRGMFRRPFSFKGRIRRKEYVISYIIYLICAFILNCIEKTNVINEMPVIYIFYYIIMVWFILAQGCKRCHDISNSGLYFIIPFYFIILFFRAGEEGSNEYGNDPKS